jgi:beta-1,2-mannobiose phosphorylase / 1,2-beta-oligomannan phosphorylase
MIFGPSPFIYRGETMPKALEYSSFALPRFLAIACLLTFSCCRTASEDSGWVRYAHNPVIKPGRKEGGTSNDYYSLSDCCVIKDGLLYKAWYSSSGPTAISPTNHCNISYAESTDGITWRKYPGNPILDIDPSSWDRYAIETVSVIIDADDGPERKYRLWYAGRTKDTAGDPGYDLGYAYSPDGISWTKRGEPVLKRGASAEWDNSFIEGPTVIKEAGTFYMWYAGMDAVANGQPTDGKVCIGLATSADGIAWTKAPSNPVLSPGITGSWDSRTVQDPCVLKYEGKFRMWFGGKANDFVHYGQQTGYADSDNGVVWRKSPANPVFARGAPGQWDSVTASFGSVCIEDSRLMLWYTGMNKDSGWGINDFWEIGYAEKPILDDVLDD